MVHKAISSKKARSETMTKWNKSQEGKKTASETAKKTSARPEIQKARATRLKKWREENPEKFAKITRKAQLSKKRGSRYEQCIREILISQGFCHNVNKRFSPTLRKQVDFIHVKKKLIIEIDGPHHFFPIHGEETLKRNQARDLLLDEICQKDSWKLLRISLDMFTRKPMPQFNLLKAIQILESYSEIGIWHLGEWYQEHTSVSVRPMILK